MISACMSGKNGGGKEVWRIHGTLIGGIVAWKRARDILTPIPAMSFQFRRRSSFLRGASSFLIIGAVILLTLQLIIYSRNRANFPPGLVVAGVPVGNLSRQQAAERLLEAYSLPVELSYEDSLIHMPPRAVDFDLDLESMIAAADLQRTSSSFWGGFLDYFFGN